MEIRIYIWKLGYEVGAKPHSLVFVVGEFLQINSYLLHHTVWIIN